MNAQPEQFSEASEIIHDPRGGDFLPLRVGEKIVHVPTSFWKDGRRRGDLSAWGLGEVVSRNPANFERRIIEALRSVLSDAIEAVHEQFSRRALDSKPQSSNKRISAAETKRSVRYINPFLERWTFAKCPDWLFARREPTHTEKQVYAKLLLPLPPICLKWDKSRGVIFGLNQGALARSLGVRRETINAAIRCLRFRGLLETTGGSGARQIIKFLWHEWMPTCALNAQVSSPRHTGSDDFCAGNEQVPQDIERLKREEKAAALSDKEWLEKVVALQFPGWSLDHLRIQWALHRCKGQQKRKWIPGDRSHFLKAWMPKAGDPPALRKRMVEPDWWTDFLSECHPDATLRNFGDVFERHPDVVDQGFRWAQANASAK